MDHPAPISPLPIPPGQPIGAHGGAGKLPTPLVPPISVTHAAHARPTRVLICVGNAGVRDLIGILLEDAGYTVIGMDVVSWLVGSPIPEPLPEVLILDAWPLRHADAVSQAHARLGAQPSALVLLMDSPQLALLADQLGAVATLPLLFTLQDLVSAVQQGSRALGREPQGQS